MSSQVLTVDLNTDCLLTTGHVLSHVVYLLTNHFITNGLSCIESVGFLVAIGSANARNTYIGEEAVRIVILLCFLADRGEADRIA